jgi:hypothetical protein
MYYSISPLLYVSPIHPSSLFVYSFSHSTFLSPSVSDLTFFERKYNIEKKKNRGKKKITAGIEDQISSWLMSD